MTCAIKLGSLALLIGLIPCVQAADDVFDVPIESLMQMRVSVASPFSESVMESASSVSVMRPQDWERRGARSVEDVLETSPSVVAYSSLGGASMFAIRGYGNDSSSRGTALLLDGVPLNNYSYATATFGLPYVALPQLQRVEMIRGPGSTLYGSDAFHGVVSLSTWEPALAQRNAKLLAGVPRQMQGVANGSAATSALSASAGVAWTDSGDRENTYRYIDPITGLPGTGEWNNNETDASGYLHLEHGGVDDGRWRFGFYADRYRASEFPNISPQFFRPLLALNPVSSDYSRDRDQMGQASDFVMAQLRYERKLGETSTLDVHAFGWQSELQWNFNASRYPDNTEVMSLGFGGCQPTAALPRWPLYCPHWQDQGTTESRVGIRMHLHDDRETGTAWAIGAGSDWFKIDEAFVHRVGVNGTTYVNAVSPFEGSDRRIDHVLAQGRTQAGSWTAVYGLRWDDYSDIGDAYSPRAALIFHQPDRHWATKMQYGRAFRAPSAAEQYGAGGGTQQIPSPGLDPETLDTLELVWQFQRGSRETELVLFASLWENGIALVPLGGGINQYQNNGRNQAHGIEFIHRQSFGAWRAEGSASWSASENRKTGIDYVGYPSYLVSFAVNRALPAGWELGVAGRAMMEMALGDAVGTYVPPDAPNYYRVDLHGGWQQGKLRGALDVRNVLDRDNVVPAMFNARSGMSDFGADVVLSVTMDY